MEPGLKKVFGMILVLFIIGLGFTIYRNVKNQEKYDARVQEMKEALKMFGEQHQEFLPVDKGNSVTLTLRTLKYFNLIDANFKNPFTKKLFSNNLLFMITKEKDGYDYIVLDQEEVKTDYDDVNTNAPFIILNGKVEEFVEVNSVYHDKGYVAATLNGQKADEMDMEVRENGKLVGGVDTSKLTTYEITYLGSYAKEQSYITRKLTVRDTKAPDITMDKITLHIDEVKDFDLMKGVKITDNSRNKPLITVTGELSAVPGKYIITYKAIDEMGNDRERKRVIRVEE